MDHVAFLVAARCKPSNLPFFSAQVATGSRGGVALNQHSFAADCSEHPSLRYHQRKAALLAEVDRALLNTAGRSGTGMTAPELILGFTSAPVDVGSNTVGGAP
jgi:hypothetical protein